jgi:predicted peptidase
MAHHALWHEDRLLGLPCRVLLPAPYDTARRYPVVVSMHGSGERGADNRAQLKNGLARFERARTAVVVAPQLPPEHTFGGCWYGGDTDGQRALVALVRALADRRTVDRDRIYGVGFSMGAIGLWDVLVRSPDLFAAAALIAGDVDVDATLPHIAGLKAWAVHGADDTLVPPHNTRALFARAPATTPARYTEVPGVGHDVWQFAFAHEPLWEWLFAQRR